MEAKDILQMNRRRRRKKLINKFVINFSIFKKKVEIVFLPANVTHLKISGNFVRNKISIIRKSDHMILYLS